MIRLSLIDLYAKRAVRRVVCSRIGCRPLWSDQIAYGHPAPLCETCGLPIRVRARSKRAGGAQR